MTFKKIAFVFCVLCSVIICSCSIENVILEYTFVNRSSYVIQITLSEPYKNNSEEEVKSTSPFYVYSSSIKKVYVQSNGTVGFQWTTAYDAANNPKVDCVTDGQKATFKNR